MKKQQTGIITKKTWEIRKESAKKFNCKVMEVIWKECIKMAIEEREITYKEWLNHYLANEKTYNYILYHGEIISKNGKRTNSQKQEQETTSSTWNILPGEEEDIRQLAHQKILEYFSRKGTIQYQHKYTLWALCCLNAIKQHTRMIKRSKMATNNEIQETGYNDSQEKVPITHNNFSLLHLDLQSYLTKDQYKICQLLEAGYQKQEIAKIMGISRPTLNSRIKKIQETIVKNGLAYC